jgi:uncharacterized protein (DUF2141 family)
MMRPERTRFVPLAVLLLASALTGFLTTQTGLAAQAASIDVQVTGLRNASGTVWICLWKEGQSRNFPNCDKYRPFAKISAPASAPRATFANVQPGAYAVSIFHDENGDGRLATNLAGLPKSAVGTSNNPALGLTSRPSFSKSRFLVSGKASRSIEAKYMF